MINIGNPSITLEDIFNLVSEETILTHYFGIQKIPCVINSPLRKDRNPSFSIYYRDSGSIGYKDFKTQECGGVIDLIMNYYHLTFQDTIVKIYQDIKSLNLTNTISINRSRKLKLSDQYDLKCKVREFKDYDLKFWSDFGISKEWLIFGNIYPISDIILKTIQGKAFTFSADKYAYVYVEFKDNQESLKIYQPQNTKWKWLNNHNASVWDLWEQLPESGENLIITSSRKDALCLWANTGIPSTSLQAEGYLPKKQVIDSLKLRFKNIYVLYDNDFHKLENYGQIFGLKLASEFDLINIFIPTNYQSKDPSDLFFNHGREIFYNTILNLLKKT